MRDDGSPLRAQKSQFESAARTRWYKYEQKRQRSVMADGPQLLADDHTIMVPSEWYQKEAAEFWKAHGFHWVKGLSRWERDTWRPTREGKIYTTNAWLTATRRQFFDFWPALKRTCVECGVLFAPASGYDTHCPDHTQNEKEQNDD